MAGFCRPLGTAGFYRLPTFLIGSAIVITARGSSIATLLGLPHELAEQVLRTSGRGRPSLTAPGERSPQLRLSVPQQLRDGLRARADAEHRSVPELAREAIDRYLTL